MEAPKLQKKNFCFDFELSPPSLRRMHKGFCADNMQAQKRSEMRHLTSQKRKLRSGNSAALLILQVADSCPRDMQCKVHSTKTTVTYIVQSFFSFKFFSFSLSLTSRCQSSMRPLRGAADSLWSASSIFSQMLAVKPCREDS